MDQSGSYRNMHRFVDSRYSIGPIRQWHMEEALGRLVRRDGVMKGGTMALRSAATVIGATMLQL
jgi:hypothetical protein